jgi:hypothetical protein
MDFVRHLDRDRAAIEVPGGYNGQFLYSAEDCHVVATLVPPSADGPAQRRHPVGEIYVTTEWQWR